MALGVGVALQIGVSMCMRNDDYMSTHFVLFESLTARTPVDMDGL